MDRGRRGMMSSSSDPRKRGKPLPPVSERASAGPYGQMIEPMSSKYGEMIEPMSFGGTSQWTPGSSRKADDSLVIDPNLLVGPLYTGNTERQSGRIKEQLTDITDKLHKTLHSFDEMADFEHGEDPLVSMMRKKMGDIDDPNVQFQLNSVMDQYEHMAQELKDANNEREEMLLQLADWFTTDHVDLDDFKTSVNDTDENQIKQSYFDTMTNFEKIKRLQQKIAETARTGKPTRQLEKKKVELEKDVVGKFRNMKDMSMQTMKLKISDDAPWKHAAHEVVNMLKNVRSENAEEMAAIQKHMKEMIDQLEKQALNIKSLTAELREKKEVVKKLTDENGDLSQDMAILQARVRRYDKDLDAAKKMIRSLHEAAAVGGSPPPISDGEGQIPISTTISKVLARFDDRKGSDSEPKQLGSDPSLLRTQVRELQEDLDLLREDYDRKNEDLTEMATTLQEKREYIESIEAENEKFSKELKKLRAFRRQSMAAAALPPAEGEGVKTHQCEHCKCHIPEKEIDEEIEELKSDVKKWQDKCNYFKKLLADTEMKLSDAFKEISDLRMDREPPPAAIKEESPEGKEKKESAKEKLDKTEKEEAKEMKLPPIEKGAEEPKIEPKTATEKREFNLYRVGDLQGKMNMLVNEIMEFVSEIGKMLYKEKEETKKIQAVTAFTFDGTQKKEKEQIDPKEVEAKQKRTQVLFHGQQAVAKLREAFDMLSNSMGLKHNEYEAIYRSFKISQNRQAIRREIIHGRLPVSALHDFDNQVQKDHNAMLGEHSMLAAYYNISYGGGTQPGVASNKPRTTLHRKSSSITSVRSESPETEEKLKETMHVLSMQRSKSDLDVRPPDAHGIGGPIHGAGMFRERESIFFENPEALRRESIQQGTKQEVKISKAVVPKKGLIALSTDEQGFGMINVIGDKQGIPSHESPHLGSGKKQPTSLIRRKDILDQIKQGNRLLEEYEERQKQEEEMTKTLGEYTMMDLQSHILGMTDARALKRQKSQTYNSPVPPNKTGPPSDKDKKPITLPKLKTLNPFD